MHSLSSAKVICILSAKSSCVHALFRKNTGAVNTNKIRVRKCDLDCIVHEDLPKYLKCFETEFVELLCVTKDFPCHKKRYLQIQMIVSVI